MSKLSRLHRGDKVLWQPSIEEADDHALLKRARWSDMPVSQHAVVESINRKQIEITLLDLPDTASGGEIHLTVHRASITPLPGPPLPHGRKSKVDANVREIRRARSPKDVMRVVTRVNHQVGIIINILLFAWTVCSFLSIKIPLFIYGALPSGIVPLLGLRASVRAAAKKKLGKEYVEEFLRVYNGRRKWKRII